MRKFLVRMLKRFLTPEQYEQFKKSCLRIFCVVSSFIYAKDLIKLAIIWRADKWNWRANKWNQHWYARHYQKYFKPLRRSKLNLLEIGVGGYENPAAGGASLRMWKYYFRRSLIFSIDIYEKSLLQEKRIKIFKGSQNDENFLKDVFERIGSLDIIIDDGSHINEHVITSFKILFPLLKNGGIYAVEDVQTSYDPQCGGDSENLNNPAATMNFFKNIADGINYKEFMKADYLPTYFDRNIIAIHFYHNLIFIFKGENNENGINNPLVN